MGQRLNGLKVPVLSIFGTGDKYLSVASAKGGRKFIKVRSICFIFCELPEAVFLVMCDPSMNEL